MAIVSAGVIAINGNGPFAAFVLFSTFVLVAVVVGFMYFATRKVCVDRNIVWMGFSLASMVLTGGFLPTFNAIATVIQDKSKWRATLLFEDGAPNLWMVALAVLIFLGAALIVKIRPALTVDTPKQ